MFSIDIDVAEIEIEIAIAVKNLCVQILERAKQIPEAERYPRGRVSHYNRLVILANDLNLRARDHLRSVNPVAAPQTVVMPLSES